MNPARWGASELGWNRGGGRGSVPGAVLGEVSDLKELRLVTFTKSPEGSYPTRLSSSPRPPFPITEGTERHREDSACRSPPAVITTTRVGLWVPAGLTESLLPAGARRELTKAG